MDGSTDQDTTRYKATIQETMKALGLSEQAVRKRVRRGTLDSEKGPDGRVYVYLSADQDATRDADKDADQDADRDTRGAVYSDLLSAKDAQLEDMRERVESLERSLDAEREANRENRRIIAGLTQRIPELEAPPQSGQEAESIAESASGGESPVEATEEYTEARSAPSHTTGASSAERRPWWRRIFGG